MKMHIKILHAIIHARVANLNLTLIVFYLCFLTACASGTVANVEDRSVRTTSGSISIQDSNTMSESDEQDTATPLKERQYHIQQAELYERQARTFENAEDSINAILSSGEFYIQAGNIDDARHTIRSLDQLQLNRHQWARYQILLGYVEYSDHQYQATLNRLAEIVASQSDPEQEIHQQQVVDALLLSSLCYQALNDFGSAISLLIEREGLLYGPAKAETSRYIWQVINALSTQQRSEIMQNSGNFAVRNRIEQSLQGEIGAPTPRPDQFDKWRGKNPKLQTKQIENHWSPLSPNKISVLLPLSSRFEKAANAVLEGIQYQHSLNSSADKPYLQVYDIGSNPVLVNQYHTAATASGSDLIIGPLGKDYANQMLTYSDGYSQVDTIVLGGDLPLRANTKRLAIGPESQGRIVADRALALGYVNAAILVPNNKNGARTAQSFTNHWLGNGGKLSSTVAYSNKQFDHSVELKQLFGINTSEYRHRKLSNALGHKPKFSSYKRHDIDFIVMISDVKAGRILRPQINFFSGSQIPVLATSAIYNGIQDPINNIDLDMTSFPVMPWVMASRDVATYAGQLNMLFALGSDAYTLAANLHRLQTDPSLAVSGNMGTLQIETGGEVRYHPLWAKYNSGLVEADSEIIPLNSRQSSLFQRTDPRRRNQQQGAKRYDESNWDPGQSRRKNGT